MKKKRKSLTKEQQEWYENANICFIYKEKFEKKITWNIKNIVNLETIVVIQRKYGEAACSIGNLKKNSAPKKNPTAFHNG